LGSLSKGVRSVLKRLYKEKFFVCNWDIDLNTEVKNATFVVFDTETTGLDLKRDYPIALGAIKVKDLTINTSEVFYSLIKPKVQLKKEAIEVHGITPSDLESAKEGKEVIRDFISFAKNSLLVGYFTYIDITMLKKLSKEHCPAPFLPYSLDLLDLCKCEEPMPLERLLLSLGIPTSSTHSPIEDAYMTTLAFLKLINSYKNEKLKELPLRVW